MSRIDDFERRPYAEVVDDPKYHQDHPEIHIVTPSLNIPGLRPDQSYLVYHAVNSGALKMDENGEPLRLSTYPRRGSTPGYRGKFYHALAYCAYVGALDKFPLQDDIASGLSLVNPPDYSTGINAHLATILNVPSLALNTLERDVNNAKREGRTNVYLVSGVLESTATSPYLLINTRNWLEVKGLRVKGVIETVIRDEKVLAEFEEAGLPASFGITWDQIVAGTKYLRENK